MIERLYIHHVTPIGPGLWEAELIAERGADLFCGQGKTREIAIDKAFQLARHERRFQYPKTVYCSEDYWAERWGVPRLTPVFSA